jgi:hypothetical protein
LKIVGYPRALRSPSINNVFPKSHAITTQSSAR